MAPQTPVTTEALRPRKIPWRKRLLVRVLGAMLLIFSISLTTWWWPRRTMLAVWYVNGTVFRNSDLQRADQLLEWSQWIGANWVGGYSDELHRFLSSVSPDIEITGVELTNAKVSDEWLVRLKQFPNLELISLHDRQLGPGLAHLRDLKQLKRINVISASNSHLRELSRLPELHALFLWEPGSGDLGLDVLPTLPNLKSLFIGDSANLGELLQTLPVCPQLEKLYTQNCKGLTDEDLSSLQRLKNLKQLSLIQSGSLGDAGFIELSKVTTLEALVLRRSIGTISDRGLISLQSLYNLTYLGLPYNWSPGQLQSLQQALPKTRIEN